VPAADRRRDQAATLADELLEPGEHVDVIVPMALDGPLWAFMTFGLLSTPFVRFYALVLTDRRLMVLRASAFPNRPLRPQLDADRAGVTLAGVQQGRRAL
jgi:hypothetical protein